MRFETDRLIIRELREEDASRFSTYRDKKEVSEYQSWNHFTLKDAIKRIKYISKHPFKVRIGSNTQLAVCLKDGTMIGDLFIEVLSKNTISIGYTLDSVYWHQGYGREMVKALLSYMGHTYGFTRAMAYIYKENDRSRDLLLDLGFHKFDESFYYHDEGYVCSIERFL